MLCTGRALPGRAAAGARRVRGASAPPAAPPPRWVYPPPPPAWPLGAAAGPDRAQPGAAARAARRDHGRPPVPAAARHAVGGPGRRPARAVIYGQEGVRPAIELIDIDRRARGVARHERVRWTGRRRHRAARSCAPDATGTRGVKLDGKGAWRSESPFIAMTDDRVVTGDVGVSIMLEATTGEEMARVKLPPTIVPESIIASCGDAGRELFSIGQDGRLVRIAEAQGRARRSPGRRRSARISSIDACDGDTGRRGDRAESHRRRGAGPTLIALARATGHDHRARRGRARLVAGARRGGSPRDLDGVRASRAGRAISPGAPTPTALAAARRAARDAWGSPARARDRR